MFIILSGYCSDSFICGFIYRLAANIQSKRSLDEMALPLTQTVNLPDIIKNRSNFSGCNTITNPQQKYTGIDKVADVTTSVGTAVETVADITNNVIGTV